jgi:hypothetical protein
MVRSIITVVVAMAVIQTTGVLFHRGAAGMPRAAWNCTMDVGSQCGTERANLNSELSRLPGKQLVIVRYASHHNSLNEWVYNSPDIDQSKVIWAREMDAASNHKLLLYYKDRKAWLVQPDLQPTAITSYPVPDQITPSSP